MIICIIIPHTICNFHIDNICVYSVLTTKFILSARGCNSTLQYMAIMTSFWTYNWGGQKVRHAPLLIFLPSWVFLHPFSKSDVSWGNTSWCCWPASQLQSTLDSGQILCSEAYGQMTISFNHTNHTNKY